MCGPVGGVSVVQTSFLPGGGVLWTLLCGGLCEPYQTAWGYSYAASFSGTITALMPVISSRNFGALPFSGIIME